MKIAAWLAVCFFLVPLPASAQTLDGDWNGTLVTPGGTLRLLFHFQTSGGALRATIDSVDQNGGTMTATPVTLDKAKLTLTVAAVAGSYEGTLSADGKAIIGTWTQRGRSLPLNLAPGSIAPRRLVRAPQPGDLTIAAPGGILAGTIWKAGDGRPAALIITGSGPANRNGDSATNGGHGTYRLIAEGLQAHGITTLSIDKRGIGESAGAMASESALRVQTYGDDIRLWAAELKTRSGARCVWLIGHSEGGLVAELAAANNPDICGIVTLAGMGRSFGTLMREQLQRTLPPALLPKALSTIDALEAGKTVPNPPPELFALFRPSVQPYMLSEINLDPAALMAALKIPLLIVQGDDDQNVSLTDARALAAARPDATLKIMPGMNHSQRLTKDDTGGPAPLAPGLTDTIAAFLKAHP